MWQLAPKLLSLRQQMLLSHHFGGSGTWVWLSWALWTQGPSQGRNQGAMRWVCLQAHPCGCHQDSFLQSHWASVHCWVVTKGLPQGSPAQTATSATCWRPEEQRKLLPDATLPASVEIQQLRADTRSTWGSPRTPGLPHPQTFLGAVSLQELQFPALRQLIHMDPVVYYLRHLVAYYWCYAIVIWLKQAAPFLEASLILLFIYFFDHHLVRPVLDWGQGGERDSPCHQRTSQLIGPLPVFYVQCLTWPSWRSYAMGPVIRYPF